MKYILRTLLFHSAALWVTSMLLPALYVPGDWSTILIAGLVLTVLTLIGKPFLKILFIPINILTFGLFSWLIHVVVMYLLTLAVPAVQVHPWYFPGVAWAGFVVPGTNLNYYMSLILVALVLTAIASALEWLCE